jgi:glycosyl transferase, family 25
MPQQRIPVFVISLSRAVDRRLAIRNHLCEVGVQYELIDAVDGKSISQQNLVHLVAPGRTMHPGAVGCYLSHLQVYERMREENTQVALILEDDARLNPKLTALLSEGCKNLNWDYCFLDSDDHNDRGPVFYDVDSARPLGGGFTAYTLSAGPQTTHAYMITRAAALRRLENAFPMQCPIDLYEHLPYRIEFAAMVNPKGAWVSEHSLESFTSMKSVGVGQLSLVALRRWPVFYRIRDLLRLKAFRRNRMIRGLQLEGRLEADRRWKALPSGREILIR